MSNYRSNTRNSGLKASVIILSLLLLASLAYTYKIKTDSTIVESALTSEKNKLQAELEIKIAEYGTAISENTALKDELQNEQAKMIELLKKVNKTENNSDLMIDLKIQYSKLKRDMIKILSENKILKERNIILAKKIDSTDKQLTDTRKALDTLLNSNNKSKEQIKIAQKLSIYNISATALKIRSNGKEELVEKAKKANNLRISFTIGENSLAKQGERSYYVQLIDFNSNVWGESIYTNFKDKEIKYSFKKRIFYGNEAILIEQNIPVEKLASGAFKVNIYDDKGDLVASNSFELK